MSLAALKSFQEILYLQKGCDNNEITHSADSEALWIVAWRVWLNIGTESTTPPQENETEPYVPSQAFLTALVHIFPAVFQHIRKKYIIHYNLQNFIFVVYKVMFIFLLFFYCRFTGTDLDKLCVVLKNVVAVPVHGESTPYILPTVPDVVLTHLQDGVLHSMELLQKVQYYFTR